MPPFNAYMERISGYKLGEVKGRSWFDTFVVAAERERVSAVFDKAKVGEPADGSANTIVTKAGQRRVLDWYNTALRDAEGRVASVLAIGHDVTDRVAAEQRIRASLEEKEVLVEGIHHRVKNNMPVISSLLRVQRRNMKGLADQCVLHAFTETERRINSMALAHQDLHRSEDFSVVDLAAYMPQVADELLDAYGAQRGAVKLQARAGRRGSTSTRAPPAASSSTSWCHRSRPAERPQARRADSLTRRSDGRLL